MQACSISSSQRQTNGTGFLVPISCLISSIGHIRGLCPERELILCGQLLVERFERRVAIGKTMHVARCAHFGSPDNITIETTFEKANTIGSSVNQESRTNLCYWSQCGLKAITNSSAKAVHAVGLGMGCRQLSRDLGADDDNPLI